MPWAIWNYYRTYSKMWGFFTCWLCIFIRATTCDMISSQHSLHNTIHIAMHVISAYIMICADDNYRDTCNTHIDNWLSMYIVIYDCHENSPNICAHMFRTQFCQGYPGYFWESIESLIEIPRRFWDTDWFCHPWHILHQIWLMCRLWLHDLHGTWM